jgi:beta-1,4-mannosyltransferase
MREFRSMNTRTADRGSGRTFVASVPEILNSNAYQRLLYEQLANHGIALIADAKFDVRWLRSHDGRQTTVHFHWPEFSYRPLPRLAGLRGTVRAWQDVARFGVRLVVARVLRYRVVWTVHQVIPHESRGLSDRVAAALLATASNALIVHDEHTAGLARRLPARANKIVVVPHASYTGVYPPGRGRTERRTALGLTWARFVFLSFGRIRGYKQLPLLLEAFAQTVEELPDVALVIAGFPADRDAAAEVERAAASDRRIRPLIGFVPDADVAELFGAADATVYGRSDGGTTGVLLLSLSLGRPVVAARVPSYQELIGEDQAGWLFEPGSARSLAQTLIRAAEPIVATVRGRNALMQTAGRDWVEVGRRTAELIR